MSKDLLNGLPDDLQDLLGDSQKESKLIEIKVERRKYGKLWAVVSGISTDPSELKTTLKSIKNKLACGGTVKGSTIEILYGRHDRSSEIISILGDLGYDSESIHVTQAK